MTKAGDRLIEGMKEALAVASGEQPAAAIYVNGIKYVPADRVERLEEALKPFAEAADIYDPPENDDHHAAWAHDFPIGALRRARAALSDGQKQTEVTR